MRLRFIEGEHSVPEEQQQPKQPAGNLATIGFIVILSVVCATVLAILSSALAKPQKVAKELDRSIQMMIAAKVMNHEGKFLVQNDEGKYVEAKYTEDGYLEPGESDSLPGRDEIIAVYRKRFKPYLVNQEGDVVTFEDAGINEEDYVSENKKQGYYKLKYKLIYEIMPNVKDETSDTKPIGYVIPVNGFGLWDAIYGYLAVKPDGNTVIGISWYDQKETPGLGANIADAEWQDHFPGKHIFQAGADGKADFESSPVGIIVVRGKVSEVLGESPKAKSAVDGMAGATLTGNGVTKAYKDVLNAYRPFFIKIHNNTDGGDVSSQSRTYNGGRRVR